MEPPFIPIKRTVRFLSVILSILVLLSCETEENKKYKLLLEQNKISFDKEHFINYIETAEYDTIGFFLKAGMDINTKIKNGLTPLIYAVSNKNFEMVNYFIEKGANINERACSGGGGGRGSGGCRQTENTALFLAVDSGFLDITKYLLDHKAKVDNGKGTNFETPLMRASKSGNIDAVKLLLDYGADVSVKRYIPSHYNDLTERGQTALIYAALNGHKEIVKLLIKNGANVDDKKESGETSFILVSRKTDFEMMRFLLENNANINYQVEEIGNWSALMYAVKNNNIEVVKFLIENGADTNIEDVDGKTAHSIAQKEKNQEIIDLLKSVIH